MEKDEIDKSFWDKIRPRRSFTELRKSIYASLNGTKGNLIKLHKSTLLSKKEKELLSKVIDDMEQLRVEFYNNRGNKIKQH